MALCGPQFPRNRPSFSSFISHADAVIVVRQSAAGDTQMYQMDEVSDSSNTSGAPAASVIGARLAPPVQLRRLSQQDAASGSDLFGDKILTVASADAGRVLPIQSTNNDVGTTVLQAATPGATAPSTAGDGMSSLGAARDLTMTDASASHVGDMLQSNPV